MPPQFRIRDILRCYRTDAFAGAGPKGLITHGEMASLIAQVKGVLSVGAYTFFGSLIVWILIKKLIGLRVTPEQESIGLDKSEMGMEAYPNDVA